MYTVSGSSTSRTLGISRSYSTVLYIQQSCTVLYDFLSTVQYICRRWDKKKKMRQFSAHICCTTDSYNFPE
jgi:hypothetical protein